jgi:hypothetical protein
MFDQLRTFRRLFLASPPSRMLTVSLSAILHVLTHLGPARVTD